MLVLGVLRQPECASMVSESSVMLPLRTYSGILVVDWKVWKQVLHWMVCEACEAEFQPRMTSAEQSRLTALAFNWDPALAPVAAFLSLFIAALAPYKGDKVYD